MPCARSVLRWSNHTSSALPALPSFLADFMLAFMSSCRVFPSLSFTCKERGHQGCQGNTADTPQRLCGQHEREARIKDRRAARPHGFRLRSRRGVCRRVRVCARDQCIKQQMCRKMCKNWVARIGACKAGFVFEGQRDAKRVEEGGCGLL